MEEKVVIELDKYLAMKEENKILNDIKNDVKFDAKYRQRGDVCDPLAGIETMKIIVVNGKALREFLNKLMGTDGLEVVVNFDQRVEYDYSEGVR